jgi:hypothetical protein
MKLIQELSKYSIRNKESIKKSKKCGCYYCLNIFYYKNIEHWIDNNQTALCPRCKIDSVIGDFDIDFNEKFLEESSNYWF